MCELGSVHFDKMVVNVDMALDYFKQKNNVFRSSTNLKFDIEGTNQDSDGYNTIHTTTCDLQSVTKNITIKEYTSEEFDDLHEKLAKLSRLVEQKSDLFSQIDYTIRKIPIDEVKNYDIKLIVQNLLVSCRNSKIDQYIVDFQPQIIMMNADSPLANIGFVTQLLMKLSNVIIVATKETAALCYLFSELCHTVGLDSVEVIFVPKYQPRIVSPTLPVGCVGVITEQSDLDSAVDVLLKTTTKYPWKLTQIYVQESIYKRFKKLMTWKSESSPGTTEQLNILKQMCENVFVYDDKTFLVDYTGAPTTESKNILVEAYRTTKELIALVTKLEAPYTSVWSSDVSEANEIAHKLQSSIIWINSYGIFDGPPITSQILYRESLNNIPIYGNIAYKDLLEEQVKWSKKSFEERRRIVHNALAEIVKNKQVSNDIKELMIAVRDLENENIVSVENGRICMGLSIPYSIVIIKRNKELYAPQIAKLLTSGAALVYQPMDTFLTSLWILNLGVPITKGVLVKPGDKYAVKVSSHANRFKIVWTSFGTIFAN